MSDDTKNVDAGRRRIILRGSAFGAAFLGAFGIDGRQKAAPPATERVEWHTFHYGKHKMGVPFFPPDDE